MNLVFNFRSIFAACDKRSHICDPDQRPPTTTSSPTTVVPTKRSFRDSIKNGFDKIKEIAGNVVKNNPFTNDDNDVALTTTDASELLPLNFSHFFEVSKSGNLSYVGFHFTFFELTSNCQVILNYFFTHKLIWFNKSPLVKNSVLLALQLKL